MYILLSNELGKISLSWARDGFMKRSRRKVSGRSGFHKSPGSSENKRGSYLNVPSHKIRRASLTNILHASNSLSDTKVNGSKDNISESNGKKGIVSPASSQYSWMSYWKTGKRDSNQSTVTVSTDDGKIYSSENTCEQLLDVINKQQQTIHQKDDIIRSRASYLGPLSVHFVDVSMLIFVHWESIRELEEYIDTLLVKVIAVDPFILEGGKRRLSPTQTDLSSRSDSLTNR